MKISKLSFIGALFLFVCIVFASSGSIVIDSPENITYDTTTIDLNWEYNESLNSAVYSLNGAGNVSLMNWEEDSVIVSNLGDVGLYSAPTTFQKDSTWYFIAGEGDGVFNGYNWTGSTWQPDSAIALGLGDVGDHSTPKVFYKDSTWYLISGNKLGTFNGFNWSGSVWQPDSVINSSLGDVGDYSTPEVFYKDSTWYLISGELSGVFYGFNWTGSAWQSDSDIVSNLGDLTYRSTPRIFQKGSVWYLISGENTGHFHGYNWTGSTWQSDSDIVSNLGNAHVYSIPTVFKKGETWYLISGKEWGAFYGFNWVVFNTSITATEGSNNITIYVNDTSTTQYFTVDTTPPTITIDSPTNTTYDTTTIDLNVSADETIDTWYYSLNSGTNTTFTPNISITGAEGSNNITIYANDTVGNLNSTTQYFTVDLPPTYSLNSTNNTHVDSSILHSLQWQDTINLSGYIFSFNNGTSFTNDTWVSMTGTLNWSNVTKTVNSTLGATIQWRVHANDTFNNWAVSDTYSYNTTNTLPTQTPVTITPLPAELTDNLTCNYVYADADNDTESGVWYRWYINDILNVTTQNLSSVSTALDDNIICSVKVYDGAENSTWANSSILTLGDDVSPVLHTQSMSGITGAINSVLTIGINITELNELTYVYVEITDPNSVATNVSATEATDVGNEYYYTRAYTPLIVGTYTFKFFAQDGSGNNADRYVGTLEYEATEAGVGGGSGGAVPIIAICGDGICSPDETMENCPQDCYLDFSIYPPTTELSISPSGKSTGRFRITNDGLLDKTIAITVEPQGYFMFDGKYAATVNVSRKIGLASGDSYVDWQVDLSEVNLTYGTHNYTVIFDDGKNKIQHTVVMTVRPAPFLPVEVILPAILAVIFLAAVVPALLTRKIKLPKQFRKSQTSANIFVFGGVLFVTLLFLAGLPVSAPEDVAPTYSENSTNSTIAGANILHKLKWEDETNLSGYIFSFCNGTYNGTDCVGTTGSCAVGHTDNGDGTCTMQLQDNETENLGDAKTDSYNSNYNYGTSTTLTLWWEDPSNANVYIKFNLSTIPDSSIIDSVNISLYNDGGCDVDNENHLLCSVGNNSWAEDTITWNNQPGIDKTILVKNQGSAAAWINHEVSNTSIVKDELVNDEVSFVFVVNATYPGGCYFYSRDYTTDTSKRPYLNITYTPASSGDWVNDTWVSMTGTLNWSNVTKSVNSTVGATIAWRVYANDTSNYWNESLVYSYDTTSAEDTCTPPDINNDWKINDTCVKDGLNINLGTGNLIIQDNGLLVLTTNTNVSAAGREYHSSGDKIHIFSGEIIIT